MRAKERRLPQEVYKATTGTPFKKGRDLCTFIICGAGTHGEERLKLGGREGVIDGTTLLQGPALPGKGVQTWVASLTLDRRRDTLSLWKWGKKNEIHSEAGKFEGDQKGSCLHGLASSVG